MEELKGIITNGIGKINKINSKLTMVTTKKPQDVLEDNISFENLLIK